MFHGDPNGDPIAVTGAYLQPYKYNGKELDTMHGLDTYDYGARQYDPILGRWDRVDPLCEKYYDVSPYAYCANNPVRYIDPDGMIIRIYEGDKEEVYSLYEIGGSYGGKDVFTQTCFNLLNKLAETPWGKKS